MAEQKEAPEEDDGDDCAAAEEYGAAVAARDFARLQRCLAPGVQVEGVGTGPEAAVQLVADWLAALGEDVSIEVRSVSPSGGALCEVSFSVDRGTTTVHVVGTSRASDGTRAVIELRIPSSGSPTSTGSPSGKARVGWAPGGVDRRGTVGTAPALGTPRASIADTTAVAECGSGPGNRHGAGAAAPTTVELQAKLAALQEGQERKEQLWRNLMTKKDRQLTVILKREQAHVTKLREKIQQLLMEIELMRRGLGSSLAAAHQDSKARMQQLLSRLSQDKRIESLQRQQQQLVHDFLREMVVQIEVQLGEDRDKADQIMADAFKRASTIADVDLGGLRSDDLNDAEMVSLRDRNGVLEQRVVKLEGDVSGLNKHLSEIRRSLHQAHLELEAVRGMTRGASACLAACAAATLIVTSHMGCKKGPAVPPPPSVERPKPREAARAKEEPLPALAQLSPSGRTRRSHGGRLSSSPAVTEGAEEQPVSAPAVVPNLGPRSSSSAPNHPGRRRKGTQLSAASSGSGGQQGAALPGSGEHGDAQLTTYTLPAMTAPAARWHRALTFACGIARFRLAHKVYRFRGRGRSRCNGEAVDQAFPFGIATPAASRHGSVAGCGLHVATQTDPELLQALLAEARDIMAAAEESSDDEAPAAGGDAPAAAAGEEPPPPPRTFKAFCYVCGGGPHESFSGKAHMCTGCQTMVYFGPRHRRDMLMKARQERAVMRRQGASGRLQSAVSTGNISWAGGSGHDPAVESSAGDLGPAAPQERAPAAVVDPSVAPQAPPAPRPGRPWTRQSAKLVGSSSTTDLGGSSGLNNSADATSQSPRQGQRDPAGSGSEVRTRSASVAKMQRVVHTVMTSLDGGVVSTSKRPGPAPEPGRRTSGPDGRRQPPPSRPAMPGLGGSRTTRAPTKGGAKDSKAGQQGGPANLQMMLAQAAEAAGVSLPPLQPQPPTSAPVSPREPRRDSGHILLNVGQSPRGKGNAGA
eukprot:TRINITY_DN50526_c0_g1_i1.p1 TRINITY_DN50526_c0_g1~~TRINITY_DN50526_c0_g1_i1.p1  ORF type:complete len:977 (+),score=184.17 TRINITY_DN50526_c0_g1_i1:81-3011(+)